MPVYEYKSRAGGPSCGRCASGFEAAQKMSDPPLARCPDCGAPVVRVISVPFIATGKGRLDDRAKHAGFHKLKRIGKGEYEKQF